MHREVNCRTSCTIIEYVRKYRPQALPQLLEGLSEQELTNEHNWISAETRDMLYERVLDIFKKEDILFDIGRESPDLGCLGIIGILIRLLDHDPQHAIQASAQYASLFNTSIHLAIRKVSPHHAEVEKTELKKTHPSTCHFTRGLYRALLNRLQVKRARIRETQCAVPIWEKGPIRGYRFHLKQDRLWREQLASGRDEDLGPFSPDETFHFAGTTYGAASCIYHLKWSQAPNWWRRLRKLFSFNLLLMEQIKLELYREYELIESQNRQLRRNNRLLEELLKERTELTQNLGEKVTARTMELEDLVAQLKELDEMKSYFLSLTSHELRTPLTIIKGALNLLLSDGDRLSAERFKRYLLMARNNADHLNMLISNLLDLSRLEYGQMKLEIESVDLLGLIRVSLEEFREMAAKRELTLQNELPAESPSIIGDPGRIKQILDNLLSNAIKFTPAKGTIRVQLAVDERVMTIRIIDSGVGISPWEQEKIFRKFQQTERSLTRESAGVGLGLAIVKELAELHEGRAWVESQKGKGSTFHVQLPVGGPKNPDHFVKKELLGGQDPPLILDSN